MPIMRVLCLHGWRTNAKVLRHQTEGLQQALKGKAEFLFLDAPFPASGPAQELVQTFYEKYAPFFQWWDAIEIDQTQEDKGTAKKRPQYIYEGLNYTIDYLTGQIQQLGPIDVILGFSQGAALTTIMNAHFQHNVGEIPWKGCMLVSGFKPRAVEAQEMLMDAFGNPAALRIPSIHLIGKADAMASQSEKLIKSYPSNVRFEHEEGHKFPTPGRHQALYADIATALVEMVTGTGRFSSI